jgi:hypothetical protein
MNKIMKLAAVVAATAVFGCNNPQPEETQEVPQTDTVTKKAAAVNNMTLPALDALFYEPDFSKALKEQLSLTAAQIEKLKAAAHTSVRDLSEMG